MEKNNYIIFLKILIFIYYCFFTNNEVIASLNPYNKYNPILEKDQKIKEKIVKEALKRFVNPLYIYYNGETSEKIFLTFTILGVCVFYKLTQNKNTGKKEGTPLANSIYHLLLCAFFAQWLVINPARIFINEYLEEYDRKFKAKL